MIWADHTLRSKIHELISGWELGPTDIQPSSIELHLGKTLTRVFDGKVDTIDLEEVDYDFLMRRHDFWLASTIEEVCIPENAVGRLEGKSSLGRLGLLTHMTAGYIDPGFKGNITLEMCNMAYDPIHLKVGMPIAQLTLQYMTGYADRPYGHPELNSHYQGQKDTTLSVLTELRDHA